MLWRGIDYWIRLIGMSFGLMAVSSMTVTLASDISSTFSLPSQQWHQISVPGQLPSEQDTVLAVFGNTLDPARYASDWILYEFRTAPSDYRQLQLVDRVERGSGYWIIQVTGSSVELQLPAGTQSIEGTALPGSPDALFSAHSLPDASGSTGAISWSLSGKASLQETRVMDARLTQTSAGPCNEPDPCTLQEAFDAGHTDRQFHAYSSEQQGYTVLAGNSDVPDWQGFWFGLFNSSSSAGRTLLLPASAPAAQQFNDEFDDASRLSQWQRRHQVEGTPAQYTLLEVDQSEPGRLVIIPTQTQGWFSDGDAPLLFKEVTGNFSVQTSVRTSSLTSPNDAPQSNFNSAGLLARDPLGGSAPENYLMINVGRQNNSISGAVGSETKTTVNSQSTLDLQQGPREGRLLLCRVDNSFIAYRRLFGESSWTQIGDWVRDDLPLLMQVGLVANAFNGPDLRASFDFVRLTIPANISDCLPG